MATPARHPDRNDKTLTPRGRRSGRGAVKIILDLFGTFVTQGHIYYCSKIGEGGQFEGRFAPLLGILRVDGAIESEDGQTLRASTYCEVGSDDDREFLVYKVAQDPTGELEIVDHAEVRFGTRIMRPDGTFSQSTNIWMT